MSERTHAHTHGHRFALGRFDHGEQAEIEELQVLVGILVDLCAVDLAETEEGGIGFVHHVEDAIEVTPFANLLHALELAHTEVEALTHDLRHTEILRLVGFVSVFGHKNFAFHPVDLVGVAVVLEVLRIVGKVVDRRHGRELVEAVDEHALRVEVGEAERPHQLRAAVLARPVFGLTQQGAAHFQIVDEIDPSEARRLFVPRAVGLVVDDARHTPHDFPVASRQVEIGFAKFKRRVLFRVVCVEHILEQIGHGVSVVLIEFVVEADELFELRTVLHFGDFYRHEVSQVRVESCTRRAEVAKCFSAGVHAVSLQIYVFLAKRLAFRSFFLCPAAACPRFFPLPSALRPSPPRERAPALSALPRNAHDRVENRSFSFFVVFVFFIPLAPPRGEGSFLRG